MKKQKEIEEKLAELIKYFLYDRDVTEKELYTLHGAIYMITWILREENKPFTLPTITLDLESLQEELMENEQDES